MHLPTKTVDLVGPRDPEREGMYPYIRRCWQVEFQRALSHIEDKPTQEALLALKALMEL